LVGSRGSESEHGFHVPFGPPTAGDFEAALNDVTMATLDFSGADRQLSGQGSSVVQMIAPFLKVLISRAHWHLLCARRFQVFLQRAQDSGEPVLQQTGLLAPPPRDTR
jgi:hypothetical protein